MTNTLSLEENKIAFIIILVSSMFIIFHIMTGTKSVSQKNVINRSKIIKQLMIDEDISKKDAEKIYYENNPQELQTE